MNNKPKIKAKNWSLLYFLIKDVPGIHNKKVQPISHYELKQRWDVDPFVDPLGMINFRRIILYYKKMYGDKGR